MKHVRIVIEATISLSGTLPIIPGAQLCKPCQVRQLFYDLNGPDDPTRSRRIAQSRCIACGKSISHDQQRHTQVCICI